MLRAVFLLICVQAVHAQAEPRYPAELGSPIFILESDPSRTRGDSVTRLWELRPSERDSFRLHSGSGLWMRDARLRDVQGWALTGFEISARGVVPGSLLILNSAHELYRMTLNEDSAMGHGDMHLVRGSFTALEHGAEGGVFAVRDGREIVRITADGVAEVVVAAAHLPTDDAIAGLVRDMMDNLWVFTASGRVLNFSVQLPGQSKAAFEQLLVTPSAYWAQQRGVLLYLNRATGQSTYLNLSSMNQQVQDGSEFTFLGSAEDLVFARIGAHVYRLQLAANGLSVSYRIVAADFFSTGIRCYGVQHGLHSHVEVLQPRKADRTGHRWGGLKYHANPTLPEISATSHREHELKHFDLSRYPDGMVFFDEIIKSPHQFIALFPDDDPLGRIAINPTTDEWKHVIEHWRPEHMGSKAIDWEELFYDPAKRGSTAKTGCEDALK